MIEANDSADAASRDEIRMHLRHIARAFQNGDFAIPMFVHDAVPSGVPEMKRLQKETKYTFEESASGGRVVISSANRDVVAAMHKFLRFQIEEHKTVDTTEVRWDVEIHPPAIAPTMRSGSVPDTTASGSGVSGCS
jgi:hypothetical protein